MGLATGTAVATIYHSSMRLGLPVPHFLGPALVPPWASQRVGSGLGGPSLGEKAHLTIPTSRVTIATG